MITAPSNEPAVRAAALRRVYGTLPALDGVDLTAPSGTCILLLGANGAGKSTLLRVLSTLIPPTSGTLWIHGADVRQADRVALRRRIGLLAHQTYLYEDLSAAENLQFYARLYGLPSPRDAAREALASAALGDRADDFVRTFSRGMKQRLAIARTLLHDPDLLLLDEPFTGLDRESCADLTGRLAALRDAGRTCVLATHAVTVAAGLADRVVVLAAGRIAADHPAARMGPRELESLLGEVTRGPAGPGGA
ncbi:MAG: ABC transporter ATP-binding protein [Acidobacteriota bacterium]